MYFVCEALGASKTIYYLNEPLYYYCENSDSAIRNLDNQFSDHHTVKLLDAYQKILADNHFDKQAQKYFDVRMLDTAIRFKKLVGKNGDRKLLINLNHDIKLFLGPFLLCKDVRIRRKIRVLAHIL